MKKEEYLMDISSTVDETTTFRNGAEPQTRRTDTTHIEHDRKQGAEKDVYAQEEESKGKKEKLA